LADAADGAKKKGAARSPQSSQLFLAAPFNAWSPKHRPNAVFVNSISDKS
jgi:hypothetical protein